MEKAEDDSIQVAVHTHTDPAAKNVLYLNQMRFRFLVRKEVTCRVHASFDAGFAGQPSNTLYVPKGRWNFFSFFLKRRRRETGWVR